VTSILGTWLIEEEQQRFNTVPASLRAASEPCETLKGFPTRSAADAQENWAYRAPNAGCTQS